MFTEADALQVSIAWLCLPFFSVVSTGSWSASLDLDDRFVSTGSRDCRFGISLTAPAMDGICLCCVLDPLAHWASGACHDCAGMHGIFRFAGLTFDHRWDARCALSQAPSGRQASFSQSTSVSAAYLVQSSLEAWNQYCNCDAS